MISDFRSSASNEATWRAKSFLATVLRRLRFFVWLSGGDPLHPKLLRHGFVVASGAEVPPPVHRKTLSTAFALELFTHSDPPS